MQLNEWFLMQRRHINPVYEELQEKEITSNLSGKYIKSSIPNVTQNYNF